MLVDLNERPDNALDDCDINKVYRKIKWLKQGTESFTMDEVDVSTDNTGEKTIVINGQEINDIDDRDPTPSNTEVTIDIGDRADAIRLAANACADELRRYARYLEGNMCVAGNEGFVSGVRNIIFSILDIFSHAANDLYALANSWRDFKQSELTQFRAAHRVKVSRIYTYTFDRLRNIEVSIPQGLIKPYFFTVTNLQNYYVEANMRKRTKVMEECLNSILKHIRTNTADDVINRTAINVLIKPYNSTMDPDRLERMYGAFQACFKVNEREFREALFEEVFESGSDLRNTVIKVIDLDDYLREVASIADRVKDMEQTASIIASTCQSLDKQAVSILADFVQMFGNTVSGYAVCANDLNRIQHNLVATLRTLLDKLGY